jgi:hypothetical protein
MPTRLLPGPGERVPSQRWWTFVRNQARVLIVSGRAADLLTRGIQAMLARIRPGLHRGWGCAITPGGQGSAPRGAVSLVPLIDMRSGPEAWSLDRAESVSEDDRSPPSMGPPHIDGPRTAARATPVHTCSLRPAIGASCWWHRANTDSRKIKLRSSRALQAALFPQVA